MGEIILIVLIFAVPVLMLAWFVSAIVMFKRTDKSDRELYHRRKQNLISASCTFGILVLAVVALMILMGLAVANM